MSMSPFHGIAAVSQRATRGRWWWSAAVLLLSAASLAQADIINVPDDQPTIQAAIDIAFDGDEVVIAVGEYFENINLLGKAITVRSTDPEDPEVVDATIINGNLKGTVVICDSGEGPETVISGLTITNGAAGDGGGMRNESSSPTVTKCVFSKNNANDGGGMYNSASNPVVTNCVFTDNEASDAGAMYNAFSSPTVINCSFTGNEGDSTAGAVYNLLESNPVFIGCSFDDNHAEYWGGGAAFDDDRIGWWENRLGECPADLDCDFAIGSADLIVLLGAWGPNPGHPADFDGDGDVGATDLIQLLGARGPCG